MQKEEERRIELENADESIGPVPVGSNNGILEVEMDTLSNIVEDFNATFGGIDWQDEDEVRRQIEDLPRRVIQDESFVNTVKSCDDKMVEIKFNEIISDIIAGMGQEKLEFMKAYYQNKEFQNFINERILKAVVKDIRSGMALKAPTAGWNSTADDEDGNVGFLEAAESDADESNGK